MLGIPYYHGDVWVRDTCPTVRHTKSASRLTAEGEEHRKERGEPPSFVARGEKSPPLPQGGRSTSLWQGEGLPPPCRKGLRSPPLSLTARRKVSLPSWQRGGGPPPCGKKALFTRFITLVCFQYYFPFVSGPRCIRVVHLGRAKFSPLQHVQKIIEQQPADHTNGSQCVTTSRI